MLEGIKWRWFLATHKHDWKYRDGVCGIHHEKGAYTLRECQNQKCRQVETIYVSPTYSLRPSVKPKEPKPEHLMSFEKSKKVIEEHKK